MTDDICARLAEPFDPAIVSWRVGPTNQAKSKGMALAYIDARDVMCRLDEVCGPENWQNDYPWSDGKRVVCRIGIKIGEDWIYKTDGAGDTDTEGEKGALSDAFKRSAVHWGIGRYLYDVKSPWVAIEQKGKSYVIADSEFPKLAATLPRTGKPADARSPAPPRQAVQPASPQQAPASAGEMQKDANDKFMRDKLSAPDPLTALRTGQSLPAPNPEEPPEVAERRRIRGLIDRYNARIKNAPHKQALELTLDDGRDDLAEIEAAGEKGQAAAATLRNKAMVRLAEFDERAV